MAWVVLALVVVALGAGALYGRWWLFRKGLPRVDGTVQVPGISAAVEIIRDTDGIPHIFASSVEDVAFGQGFVHAQDRLWQMELSRRIGAGRLSEFAGKAAIDADRFLRRVGLRRAAQRDADQLLAEERQVLMAYARGVNAAIEDMGPNLPLELRLLRIKPEPWSIVDSLSWARVMSLNLSVNWEIELFRARLVAKVGVERAVQLHLPHFPGAPPIVPSPPGAARLEAPSVPNIDGSAEELLKLYNDAKPYLPFGELGASNNWVVAGSRTASGRPMLANDPHLALQLPNLWHEVHLVAPGLDVYGAALPGSPARHGDPQ